MEMIDWLIFATLTAGVALAAVLEIAEHKRERARAAKGRGFTLIELMIVLAIIGILVALALPQYNNYTIRAYVSEGLMVAEPAKVAVSDTRQANGVFPVANAEAGWPGASTALVASVNIGAGGVVTVAYSATDARLGAAAGKTLDLTPTDSLGAVTWACSTSTSPAPMDMKFLPPTCRH